MMPLDILVTLIGLTVLRIGAPLLVILLLGRLAQRVQLISP